MSILLVCQRLKPNMLEGSHGPEDRRSIDAFAKDFGSLVLLLRLFLFLLFHCFHGLALAWFKAFVYRLRIAANPNFEQFPALRRAWLCLCICRWNGHREWAFG